MKWKDKLLKKLAEDLKYDTEWNKYIEKLKCDYPRIGVHLAVFSDPILDELFAGNKTVESRFSTNRISPFGKVRTGDIVLVKKSGGPVMGVFVTGSVSSFSNLTPAKMKSLRIEYSNRLGLSQSNEFWSEKASSKYGTLITIKHFKKIMPYHVEKKDRIGWVVVQERDLNNIFNEPT